VSSTTLTFLLE